MVLTDKAKEIYNLLYIRDFSADSLRLKLSSGCYSPEDVNLAAFCYVDDCLDDLEDHKEITRKYGEVVPGFESSHMVEAMQILLEYGLDPNLKFNDSDSTDEECNIMHELHFVENGYIAADTLSLFLEHGGNPNILINGSSFVRDINWHLTFDLFNMPNRFRYDALVHYWMVLIGYGAKLEDGEPTIDPSGSFDISKLRNHRNYYYGAIESDRSEDHMEICFFDKETNCEVARF